MTYNDLLEKRNGPVCCYPKYQYVAKLAYDPFFLAPFFLAAHSMKYEKATDGLHPKDLLLPLVGALWACSTLIFSLATYCDVIRNRVLLGRDGSIKLPMNYREHIIMHDWVPYAFLGVFICIGFSTLAAYAPRLLSQPEHRRAASPIARSISITTIIYALVWVMALRGDYSLMRAAMKAKTPPATLDIAGE